MDSEIEFEVRHYYEKTCFFGTFFAQSEKCSENKIDIEKIKKLPGRIDLFFLLKKPIEKISFLQIAREWGPKGVPIDPRSREGKLTRMSGKTVLF